MATMNSLDFQFPIDSGKNREAGTLMKLNFLFIVCLIWGVDSEVGALSDVIEIFLPEGEILCCQVRTLSQLGALPRLWDEELLPGVLLHFWRRLDRDHLRHHHHILSGRPAKIQVRRLLVARLVVASLLSHYSQALSALLICLSLLAPLSPPPPPPPPPRPPDIQPGAQKPEPTTQRSDVFYISGSQLGERLTICPGGCRQNTNFTLWDLNLSVFSFQRKSSWVVFSLLTLMRTDWMDGGLPVPVRHWDKDYITQRQRTRRTRLYQN